MKHLLRALLLTLLAAASASPKSLVLRHVNIVDVNAGTVRRDMTVEIAGNRIAAISPGAADVPPDANVVDASGKYVIPGLWDMHVHWYDKRYLPLFIANGVTGMRQMWGMPEHHQWRIDINTGSLVGPREVIASAIIDGPKPIWPNSVAVKDAAEGRAAVIREKEKGADFIKVYSLLPRDAFMGIVAEAKEQHISFAGHVPNSVRASEASDAGMKSMEHLSGVLLECSTHEDAIRQALEDASAENTAAVMRAGRAHARELLETWDDARAAALFAHFLKNGTWQCPTLTVNRAFAYLDDPNLAGDPRLRYMPEAIRQSWDPKNDFRSREVTPEDYATRKATFARQLQIVGAMRRAGVDILAGTDVLNPYCFPGFSLHDELALLVQAGLPPLDALRAATTNPARFLGTSEFGGVEEGRIADLVVLDANPLEDIHNTRRINAVIFDGKYYPRRALDRMLRDVEALAATKTRR
jgi:imidazolonepropionase-like amidohydrolase